MLIAATSRFGETHSGCLLNRILDWEVKWSFVELSPGISVGLRGSLDLRSDEGLIVLWDLRMEGRLNAGSGVNSVLNRNDDFGFGFLFLRNDNFEF